MHPQETRGLRVTQVEPDRKGFVCAVAVRMAKSILRRPVDKVYPVEEHVKR